MQKTNFQFEILLGEDASTDGTREICIEYAKKYPNKIKLFLHSRENNIKINGQQTGRFNFLYNLSSACGKYIALCEGDDYWTDPLKLQKQVDFLEANPESAMVCTDYNRYYQKIEELEKNCFPRKYIDTRTVIFTDYIIDRSTICTATTVFRNNIYKEFLKEIGFERFSKWNVGDTPMWLYFALKSKIKVLPDITAVYRINNNSASRFTDVDEKYKFRIKGYEIPIYFKETYNFDETIKEIILENYYRLFLQYRYDAKNKDIGIEEFTKLKKLGRLTLNDYIWYYFYDQHILSYYLLFPLRRIFRKLNKLQKKF